MASNWLVFDRIRALTKQFRIYQSERTYQDQSHLDKLAAGGDFLDFSQPSAILDQTNLQINRLERYKDYEQMDETGEISLGLDLYADEASLVDPERKHTLIIRARNGRLKRELEDLFFNILRWDTFCRPTIRYLCKYGDSPFEVVLNAERSAVSALKFMNVYNFTRIETRYGDLVGFFYMDSILPRPMFLHPWQVMHLRLTSFENIYHPYGRCLASQTMVSTPNGPIQIKDIQEGQEVYSWDGKKAVKTRVVAKVCSGKKKLWRIKTRHHELECTAEHPILIDNKYKMAKDLKCGDRVIVPKIDSDGYPIKLRLSDPNNNNCVIPTIPAYVDEDFSRLCGFLIGDGWVGDDHVSFAIGEHDDINNKYMGIFKSYGLHCTIRHDNDRDTAVVCNCVLFADLMRRMGICGKANTKCIPSWVFSASKNIRRSFLEGYADADGCRRDDGGVCLTSCNKPLLRQMRYLINSLGYKCGVISGPFHNNSELCDSDRDLVRYNVVYYEIDNKSNCLTNIEAIAEAVSQNTGYAGTLRSLGYRPHGSMYTLLKSRIRDYGIDTSHFKGLAWNKGGASTAVLDSPRITESRMEYITEQIISVQEIDKTDDVYDIQVEDHHNFIAEGIVVHNSIIDGGRKAFKQLRLMEDAALIYRITRAPEKRKFSIPVGNIPPKEVPEYMQMIARNFKRQRFYNPTTGTFDERYSPLIQEDDFFLPRRPDGTGPDVDVLPGAENLDQIKDIEYFKKKMISPMKIPFARVGIGDGAGEASEKSLSQSHSEFAKAVQWVQREVATGLTKVAIIHLALRGYRVEDLRGFEIALTATSAMEELYRIETWQTRVAVMADLKDLGWFPKEWIVTHFTDLSPDEIQELKDMEQEATQSGGPGGGLDLNVGDKAPAPEDNKSQLEDDINLEDQDLDLDNLDNQPDGQVPQLEGFDYNAERRMLLELNKANKRKDSKILLEKWSERLGRTEKSIVEYTSGYDHILNSKELDGLSGTVPKETISEDKNSDSIVDDIYNPNNDEGLLVKWSVDEVVRNEAIEEIYNVLTSSIPPELTDTEEITVDDMSSVSVSDL